MSLTFLCAFFPAMIRFVYLQLFSDFRTEFNSKAASIEMFTFSSVREINIAETLALFDRYRCQTMRVLYIFGLNTR